MRYRRTKGEHVNISDGGSKLSSQELSRTISPELSSKNMARRPESEKPDVLSEEDLKQLRHNLAHLSPSGVRDFYERAFEDCRLVYSRLPSPRKMQTLVQVWKQLWKWRR